MLDFDQHYFLKYLFKRYRLSSQAVLGTTDMNGLNTFKNKCAFQRNLLQK